MSDPKTNAPNCADVYFSVMSGNSFIKRTQTTDIKHATRSNKWIIHKFPGSSLSGSTQYDLAMCMQKTLANDWLAMSSEISASMLVLPKYARFFTLNFWMRSLALPSTI